MFYKDSNNNKYYLGRAFDYGTGEAEIQYSAGAATHAKFTELGFTQVTLDPRPDGEFYIVTGPDINGAFTSTPRNLNELKIRFIYEEKLQARSILESTDWLVARNQETGEAIPANYVTYRAAVRTVNNTRCNEINAVSTVAELQTLIRATDEIEDTNNPGTFIQNPAALTNYPDPIDETTEIQSDYGL